MSPGNNMYYDTLKRYAEWNMCYHNLKWWQFDEKRIAKNQIDWYYPVVKNILDYQMKMSDLMNATDGLNTGNQFSRGK